MPTIDSGRSSTSRIAAGEDVLRAAKHAHVKPVAAKLAAFAKTHAAYVKAEAVVEKARDALATQQRAVGEKDAVQDEVVDALASALAGDGFPRTNPFKPFGARAPSKLKVVAAVDEAEEAIALASKVGKHAAASKASRGVAAKLTAASRAVIAAAKPLDGLAKRLAAAQADRDALALPWEKAFSVLKRAARAAGDDGAPGLYEALFVRSAPKPAAKKAAAKKPAPAPTP